MVVIIHSLRGYGKYTEEFYAEAQAIAITPYNFRIKLHETNTTKLKRERLFKLALATFITKEVTKMFNGFANH
jgi:hypothetical protein